MTYQKEPIDRKGAHETRAGVVKPPLDDRSQILIQQATTVADFLRTNKITIVPSDTADNKFYIFTFYKNVNGKPEEIAEMVHALSDTFRLSLNRGEKFITVSDEINRLKAYMKVRR